MTRRKIAVSLVKHAAAVLRSRRSVWADAMRGELDHIENDTEAAMWAAGCVLASYVERSGIGYLLHTWYVRALLTLFILSQVLSMSFATLLTWAYRWHHLQIATLLGAATPGDDYHRFIPLMESMPLWIHALWVAAAALFLLSGFQLLRRKRSAFGLFAAAWALGAMGNWAASSLPAYHAIFSFPTFSVMRDVIVPTATAILPVLIALAIWAHGRYSIERPA